jgi:hypothetical protein
MPSDTPTGVDVRLTPDEALVLFGFLSRYSDSDQLRVEDQAEQRVLWNLCCLLEKQLVEPFKPNYMGLLKSARSRVRNERVTDSEQDAPPIRGLASPPGNSEVSEGPPLVS